METVYALNGVVYLKSGLISALTALQPVSAALVGQHTASLNLLGRGDNEATVLQNLVVRQGCWV